MSKTNNDGESSTTVPGSVPGGDSALRPAEVPFRAIAESAHAAISVKDTVGRYLFVNQQFEAFAGVTAEGLVGRTDAEALPRGLCEVFADNDQQALSAGGPVDSEERVLHADGVRTYIAERFPLREASGTVYAVCRIATDVTDRKRAEAALDENREKYRGLSEAAFESIFISERGICLEQNCTAEQTFGYTAAEAVGRSGIEWIAPEDRPLVMQNMLAGHEEPYQVTALRKDGTTFPAIIRGKMMHFMGRRVRVTSLSDITELKHREAELRHAQKMDLVGSLAGGIAHDFNNVLAAILGEASFALDDQGVPAAVRESLDAIVAAAERGASLTHRLLTFARPERDRPRVVADLGALLNNVLPMLRRLLATCIVLEVRAEERCAAVVDASQIEQVIVNLVVNARDAIVGTGTISVTLEPATIDSDGGGLGLTPGPYVRLTVSDTGSGIAPGDLPRIFEPFFTTKPVGQGTGLGLSVVLNITRLHRGAVAVHSIPAVGTSFEVYLPHASARPAPLLSTEPARAMARPGETILLAEDEPLVRASATRILERAGYRVFSTQNGLEAIEVYREHGHAISMVILDAIMPGMTGQSVYETLVAVSPQRLRVLFCSGFTTEDNDPERRLAPGCRFLAKPFQASDLLAQVRATLDA